MLYREDAGERTGVPNAKPSTSYVTLPPKGKFVLCPILKKIIPIIHRLPAIICNGPPSTPHFPVHLHNSAVQEELLAVIGNYEGLVVRSGVTVDEDLIAAAKSMRIVGRAGTGTRPWIRL